MLCSHFSPGAQRVITVLDDSIPLLVRCFDRIKALFKVGSAVPPANQGKKPYEGDSPGEMFQMILQPIISIQVSINEYSVTNIHIISFKAHIEGRCVLSHDESCEYGWMLEGKNVRRFI